MSVYGIENKIFPADMQVKYLLVMKCWLTEMMSWYQQKWQMCPFCSCKVTQILLVTSVFLILQSGVNLKKVEFSSCYYLK